MRTTLLHLLTPHHTNNYRARILHPAGLSVLVAILLLTQTWVQLMAYSLPVGGFVLGYASNITAGQTVDLTNNQRAQHGLPSLTLNSQLTQAAVAKANHMFANDYWAHIAPDGTTPWVFIRNAGYSYAVAGENLARDFDSSDAMVQAWMNSPTHRENILHEKYTQIGVGVVNGTLEGVETTLVVQMFGQPSNAVAQTSPTAAESTQQAVAPPTLAPTVNLESTTQPTIAPTTSPVPTLLPTTPPVAAVQTTPPPAELLGATLHAPDYTFESRTLVSPLMITKSITTAVVLLLLAVLLYDTVYIHHAKVPRKVGKNWAHVSVMAFVLVFILLIGQGKVL